MSDSTSILFRFYFSIYERRDVLLTRKRFPEKRLEMNKKREDALMDAPSEHVTGVSININR